VPFLPDFRPVGGAHQTVPDSDHPVYPPHLFSLAAGDLSVSPTRLEGALLSFFFMAAGEEILLCNLLCSSNHRSFLPRPVSFDTISFSFFFEGFFFGRLNNHDWSSMDLFPQGVPLYLLQDVGRSILRFRVSRSTLPLEPRLQPLSRSRKNSFFFFIVCAL